MTLTGQHTILMSSERLVLMEINPSTQKKTSRAQVWSRSVKSNYPQGVFIPTPEGQFSFTRLQYTYLDVSVKTSAYNPKQVYFPTI